VTGGQTEQRKKSDQNQREREKLWSHHDSDLILMIFSDYGAAPLPVLKRLHDDITQTLSA
jgi:hypothetical protein